MHTTITARHCEVPTTLRERALTILRRLTHLVSRAVNSAVIFDRNHAQQTVEVRLHVARGEVFVARGEAKDHRTALSRAERKLRRQIDKMFPRFRRRRRTFVREP